MPLGGFVPWRAQNPGEERRRGRRRPHLPRRRPGGSGRHPGAGPAFNLVFPFFAFFVAFLGDHQVVASRVGWVEPGYPAATAGMLPGDVITKVDGKAIRAFDEIGPALDGVFDRPVAVTVERGDRSMVLRMTPLRARRATPIEKVKRGLLGISPVTRPAIVGVPEGSRGRRRLGSRRSTAILSVERRARCATSSSWRRCSTSAKARWRWWSVRSELTDVGGADVVVPAAGDGGAGQQQRRRGLAALGAESADSYVWTVFPGRPRRRRA